MVARQFPASCLRVSMSHVRPIRLEYRSVLSDSERLNPHPLPNDHAFVQRAALSPTASKRVSLSSDAPPTLDGIVTPCILML
ncbi:hypothetical protein L210DRAFT_3541353 [Boletus edulis BED1]|uniref:Uncharacterized protein n=1 Tax=Boletus edulis BED1 TaxID=1328754 RepID=A0AAD4BU71_BOLED|nr:hypothetical protein L210DRAFT_3541353 [Boletus edulis BED1]